MDTGIGMMIIIIIFDVTVIIFLLIIIIIIRKTFFIMVEDGYRNQCDTNTMIANIEFLHRDINYRKVKNLKSFGYSVVIGNLKLKIPGIAMEKEQKCLTFEILPRYVSGGGIQTFISAFERMVIIYSLNPCVLL